MSKKLPTTIKGCNAEIEKTNEQIRQHENRRKILNQRIRSEAQRIRTHRLIERGAILDSIFLERKDFSGEEVKAFLERLREDAGEKTSPQWRRQHAPRKTGQTSPCGTRPTAICGQTCRI